VLDERLARQHARRLGLRLTGTLGVLVKAKQGGLIPAVAPLVADLRRGGIWLSDALVEEALRLADEL
jgi:predicted nucleic acid-binding protein